MRELSPFNFGLVVAYLVPGFVVLWAAGYHNATVRTWLAASSEAGSTVGGLLYATLASLAIGMIVSVFRWAIVDTLHHRTGLHPPPWDFSHLHDRLAAFEALIEIHYRYYQFHANMLVALPLAYIAWRFATDWPAYQMGAADVGFIAIECVLFFGSRDALRKYYIRGNALLGSQLKEHRHDQRRTGTPSSDKGNRTESQATVREEQRSASEEAIIFSEADAVDYPKTSHSPPL